MFWGSHAEKVVVPALITWPIPDGADLVACACVPVAFGTADDCLFEFGRLQAGETALIQAGASGVGVAAIQLAKRAGATVIATASSLERLERLKALGLDHAVDYTQSGWVDRVRELTDGRGVDVVVDSVGGHILNGSVACLAYRGRCITVGSAGREEQLIDVRALGAGNQSITGVFLGAELFAGRRAYENIARLIDLAAVGEIEVVVDRTFPLADAAGAHQYIEDRKSFGRVVLIP
jgi:NADPH2:quinone reductase